MKLVLKPAGLEHSRVETYTIYNPNGDSSDVTIKPRENTDIEYKRVSVKFRSRHGKDAMGNDIMIEGNISCYLDDIVEEKPLYIIKPDLWLVYSVKRYHLFNEYIDTEVSRFNPYTYGVNTAKYSYSRKGILDYINALALDEYTSVDVVT